jgi:hypothetical protein
MEIRLMTRVRSKYGVELTKTRTTCLSKCYDINRRSYTNVVIWWYMMNDVINDA